MSATVTVTEDVTVVLSPWLPQIDVYDSATVTESLVPKLICNIKSAVGAPFGRTTIGGTRISAKHRVFGCKFTSGSAGTLEKLTFYTEAAETNWKVKCAIYNLDLSLVTNGVTEEHEEHGAGWLDFVFPTPPTVLANTEYYLCLWANWAIGFWKDAGDDNQAFWDDKSYNTFPDPAVPGGYTDYHISIYATYTADTLHDSVSVTESVSMAGGSYVSVSDNVIVTDVEAVHVLTLFALAVYDSVTVTESLARRLTSNISVYDSLTLTELVETMTSLGDIDVSDNLTVTESMVARLVNLISVNDGITLSELVSGLTSIAGISVSDAITVIEKLWMELWIERDKETDTWVERTKEDDEDDWDEREKETDTWDERENKESG